MLLATHIATILRVEAAAYERLSDEARFDHDMVHVRHLRKEAESKRLAAECVDTIGIIAAIKQGHSIVRIMLAERFAAETMSPALESEALAILRQRNA